MLVVFGVIFSVLGSAVLDKKAKFDECMLDESTSKSCVRAYEEYYKQVKYNQERIHGALREMIKWLTGVSDAIILAIFGWAWMFVLMGYQAQADITELKKFTSHLNKDNSELKAEIRSVKAIGERTEKNTNKIIDHLLNRAIK